MSVSSVGKERLGPAEFRETSRIVGWALGAYTAVQIVGMVLAQNAIGATSIGALAAEFMAGKVGIAWSDPHAKEPSSRDIAVRAGRGALLGVVLSAAAFIAVFAHGGTTLRGHFGVAAFGVGVLAAGLAAVRDELLLRGFVLRAFRPVVPLPLVFVICGLCGAAAKLGDEAATPFELVSSAALAVAFAAAWVQDRGAWAAWGAHTAWLLATTTLGRGALFDVKTAGGANLENDPVVAAALVVLALSCAAFSVKSSRVLASPSSG
ncbi:MAG: CPBP family glutamic-type intramembrane protease [Polyangiaceae bacterium]